MIEQCYEWKRITGNQLDSNKQNDSPDNKSNIGHGLNLNRIYIGNQFCHLLFPDEKELFMMLEKAYKESLGITIAFSYIREFMLKPIEELINRLAQWCKEKDTCIEIVINDWAMADIIAKQNAELAIKKSEAINEMRQYLIPCLGSGAFCNSLHCDEMGYLCRVPYHLEKIAKKDRLCMYASDYSSGDFDKINECKSGNGERHSRQISEVSDEESVEVEDETWLNRYDDTGYLCGETGCGLCALYQLQKAGITHLKLVGRGNYVDFMEQDIRNLRRALDILDKSLANLQQDQDNEKIFQQQMKQTIFPNGCSENCYYR